jgi:hypothetical protein
MIVVGVAGSGEFASMVGGDGKSSCCVGDGVIVDAWSSQTFCWTSCGLRSERHRLQTHRSLQSYCCLMGSTNVKYSEKKRSPLSLGNISTAWKGL